MGQYDFHRGCAWARSVVTHYRIFAPGRVVTVRFLSVNGEQNQAKRGNERSRFSNVSLYLVVRFGMAW